MPKRTLQPHFRAFGVLRRKMSEPLILRYEHKSLPRLACPHQTQRQAIHTLFFRPPTWKTKSFARSARLSRQADCYIADTNKNQTQLCLQHDRSYRRFSYEGTDTVWKAAHSLRSPVAAIELQNGESNVLGRSLRREKSLWSCCCCSSGGFTEARNVSGHKGVCLAYAMRRCNPQRFSNFPLHL